MAVMHSRSCANIRWRSTLSLCHDLPDPGGELARFMPSNSIQEANKAVSKTDGHGSIVKRKGYQEVSLELKTKIAKYALVNGVQSAVNKFKNKVPNPPRNWHNTVRDWKEGYQQELLRKRKVGSLEDVVLPVKKRGRPLLVGEILDKQVQMYIKELQKGHCIVNTAILISAAQGIVMAHDANLLSCNGGSIELKREWAKSLMMRMGLSKRKATTQSSLSKFDFDEV